MIFDMLESLDNNNMSKLSVDDIVKHNNSNETAVTCNTSKTELVRSSSL
jgi:hypothetical protein